MLSPQRKGTFFRSREAGARFVFGCGVFRFFRPFFLLLLPVVGDPCRVFALFMEVYPHGKKAHRFFALFASPAGSLCSEVVGVRPDHDDRVVRGIAVVVFTHRDITEAVGAVECLGGGVLSSDLEKENFQPAGL